MSFQSHFEYRFAVSSPCFKTCCLSHGSDVAVHREYGLLVSLLPTRFSFSVLFQDTSPITFIADAFCECNQKFKLSGRR